MIECPRMLTQDEIESIDWNDYTPEEIDQMIADGMITEQDIEWYYNNNQWRDDSVLDFV